MNNPPGKLCPRCQTLTGLAAPSCLACGHVYRTQFTPPVPVPSFQFPPIRVAPTPRLSKWLTLGLAGFAALGLVTLWGSAVKHSVSARSSASFTVPDKTSPKNVSENFTAHEIYQNIHGGMTLTEMTEKLGRPDGQEATMREGIYGSDPQGRIGAEETNARLKREVDAVLPAGYDDSSQRRVVWYIRGAESVQITMVGAQDIEHGFTGLSKPPVWVALHFEIWNLKKPS